jgi:hypothetical protein
MANLVIESSSNIDMAFDVWYVVVEKETGERRVAQHIDAHVDGKSCPVMFLCDTGVVFIDYGDFLDRYSIIREVEDIHVI